MISSDTVTISNIPWVEKYRPVSLDEIVSHEEIVRTLETFLSQGMLPNLLFYGPPGTGKTSTVLACARRLYKPREFGTMVLELNASDDRGIGIVRGPVLNFASTRTIFCSGFKLIVLDEADAMTRDAQNALRRILEKYTENVRFCLICNSLHRIIPAIQSRCTRFRFGPLEPDLMVRCVRNAAEKEDISLPHSGQYPIGRIPPISCCVTICFRSGSYPEAVTRGHEESYQHIASHSLSSRHS